VTKTIGLAQANQLESPDDCQFKTLWLLDTSLMNMQATFNKLTTIFVTLVLVVCLVGSALSVFAAFVLVF